MLSFLVAKFRRDSGYERDGCPGKLKYTTSLQWTNRCLQLETSTGIESITVDREIAPLQFSRAWVWKDLCLILTVFQVQLRLGP